MSDAPAHALAYSRAPLFAFMQEKPAFNAANRKTHAPVITYEYASIACVSSLFVAPYNVCSVFACKEISIAITVNGIEYTKAELVAGFGFVSVTYKPGYKEVARMRKAAISRHIEMFEKEVKVLKRKTNEPKRLAYA